jgi:hypothetical protein
MRVQITYEGGWTATTIPATVERVICELASQLLDTTLATRVPVGASTVSAGDLSVQFAVPPGELIDSLLPGASHALRAWRCR